MIIDITSESKDSEWEDESSNWMAALAPVREEVLSGDYRPLYLGWLIAMQAFVFS